MKLLAEVKTETLAPTASDLAPSRARRHPPGCRRGSRRGHVSRQRETLCAGPLLT